MKVLIVDAPDHRVRVTVEVIPLAKKPADVREVRIRARSREADIMFSALKALEVPRG